MAPELRGRATDQRDGGAPLPTLLWVLLCLAFLQGCATFAVDNTGRIVGVTDGDRLSFLHDDVREQVQVYGIDCPELEQPFGKEAKEATERLALNQPVTVKAWGTHPYTGRMIVVVLLPDGKNLGQELVRAGLAWWDRYYEHERKLAALEADARAAKRGLWVDPNPVPPWEFRPPWQRRRLPP